MRSRFATTCGQSKMAFAPEDERLFTWWPYWRAAREKNVGWRLDYVLVPQSVARFPLTARVLREHGHSDHGPLVVEIDERALRA